MGTRVQGGGVMDVKTAQNIIETERLGGATASATVVMLAQEWLAHEETVAELRAEVERLRGQATAFALQSVKVDDKESERVQAHKRSIKHNDQYLGVR
jgi:hypothetical protein